MQRRQHLSIAVPSVMSGQHVKSFQDKRRRSTSKMPCMVSLWDIYMWNPMGRTETNIVIGSWHVNQHPCACQPHTCTPC